MSAEILDGPRVILILGQRVTISETDAVRIVDKLEQMARHPASYAQTADSAAERIAKTSRGGSLEFPPAEDEAVVRALEHLRAERLGPGLDRLRTVLRAAMGEPALTYTLELQPTASHIRTSTFFSYSGVY